LSETPEMFYDRRKLEVNNGVIVVVTLKLESAKREEDIDSVVNSPAWLTAIQKAIRSQTDLEFLFIQLNDVRGATLRPTTAPTESPLEGSVQPNSGISEPGSEKSPNSDSPVQKAAEADATSSPPWLYIGIGACAGVVVIGLLIWYCRHKKSSVARKGVELQHKRNPERETLAGSNLPPAPFSPPQPYYEQQQYDEYEDTPYGHGDAYVSSDYNQDYHDPSYPQSHEDPSYPQTFDDPQFAPATSFHQEYQGTGASNYSNTNYSNVQDQSYDDYNNSNNYSGSYTGKRFVASQKRDVARSRHLRKLSKQDQEDLQE